MVAGGLTVQLWVCKAAVMGGEMMWLRAEGISARGPARNGVVDHVSRLAKVIKTATPRILEFCVRPY